MLLCRQSSAGQREGVGMFGGRGSSVTRVGQLAGFLVLSSTAQGQEVGWHFSPLPGEGDRAALGCARDSDPEIFACLAVRCEDDFTVGIHMHTSRPEGDLGDWVVNVDRERFPVSVVLSDAPYGGRIEGDVSVLLYSLKQGEAAYVDPPGGGAAPRNYIPLDGSLMAINEALAWCAPRVPVEAVVEGVAPEPMVRPE
jgi:hypothetical protein